MESSDIWLIEKFIIYLFYSFENQWYNQHDFVILNSSTVLLLFFFSFSIIIVLSPHVVSL